MSSTTFSLNWAAILVAISSGCHIQTGHHNAELRPFVDWLWDILNTASWWLFLSVSGFSSNNLGSLSAFDDLFWNCAQLFWKLFLMIVIFYDGWLLSWGGRIPQSCNVGHHYSSTFNIKRGHILHGALSTRMVYRMVNLFHVISVPVAWYTSCKNQHYSRISLKFWDLFSEW